MRVWLMVLGLAGWVGCSNESTPVSPFPIPADLDAGPMLIGISTTGTDAAPFTAVVDTLSPLTVVDVGRLTGMPAPEAPRRHRLDLVLHGLSAEGAVPQVRFRDMSVLDLYPCGTEEDETPTPCLVGQTGQERAVQAVLGADLLASGAVRFAFAASRMFLFPDITGSDEERTRLCEAVFKAPFHGGGTMVLNKAEISYSGRRIALGACVYQDALAGCTYDCDYEYDYDEEKWKKTECRVVERDLDGLFLVSTGLPISVVSERFYKRYQAFTGAPPLASLPEASMLSLPSGAISVRLGELRNLALVGEASDDRGPCMERCTNACMQWKTREDEAYAGPAADADCCAKVNASSTRAGAAVDLRGPFAVAIVSDAVPLLQALRDELRPELPEVDGILAPNALMPLVVDVDYPNNRVLARCARLDDPACLTWPSVTGSTSSGRGDGRDCPYPPSTPITDAGVPDAAPDAEAPPISSPD